jgi:hypothetical protein
MVKNIKSNAIYPVENSRCDETVTTTEPAKPVSVSLPFDNRWQNGGIIIVCEDTSVYGSASVHTPLSSTVFTTIRFEHRLLPQSTISIEQVDVNGISATNVLEV